MEKGKTGIKARYQLNPGGREILLGTQSYEVDGLKEIVRVLDTNPGAWKSIRSRADETPEVKMLLERARNQKLDVFEAMGDSPPQIMIISPSTMGMLAKKLEAAIVALGALKRTGVNHAFNASILYPEGPVAIIANPKGREQISHCRELLAALQKHRPREGAAHPSR